MKLLWRYIDNQSWLSQTKYKVALLILSLIFAFAGYVTWLFIRTWAFSTWDWMLCFIGYPFFFSWLVVFFYSCDNRFHDGRAGE